MKKEEILSLLRSLSMSQGFYGRLLNAIEEEPEILFFLERKNFQSEVELIMFLEGGC